MSETKDSKSKTYFMNRMADGNRIEARNISSYTIAFDTSNRSLEPY